MLERIICLAIGYACGLFQTAYIYGRINHIDIREHGSGNAGTTNAMRTLGKKAGVVTFLGDFLKPMLAAVIVYFLYRESFLDYVNVLTLYAGIGAVLGHVFPCYLGFHGGKGIATIAGMGTWFGIVSHSWYLIPIGILTFLIVVIWTRYVSVGSLVLIIAYLVEMIILGQLGLLFVKESYVHEVYGIIFLLTILAFYKHGANIKRLMDGTENKIGAKRKED